MNYVPWTEGGVVVAERELGGFRTALLTEVESPGGIKYAHVLFVTTAGSDVPVLAVASERMATPGRGSHALGLFPGNGHVNLGASDEWANLRAFDAEAHRVAAENLGLSGVWVDV